MIQRIQTLYLFLVVVLTGVILATNILSFTNTGLIFLSPYRLYNETGITIKEAMPLATLFHLSFILVATAIFFYKKRVIQIRISIFSLVLYLGSYALIAYYYFTFKKDLSLEFNSFKIGAVIPLINAILLYLAVRSIGKDEALVRSLDRIR
ncbi:DUF4293 domain-containing protein [Saccharicrinis sp. FJH2]|uniref:DUF4293 domain-containing protein n=1 Tax=Saccharicrinis sp. FJH65 TaxID=3344659 RepID=UPI0035F3A20E